MLQSLKSKYSKHKNRNQFSFKQLSDEELKTLQKKYFSDFPKNLTIKGLINSDFVLAHGFSYKPSKNSFRQNKDNINSKFYTNTNINLII